MCGCGGITGSALRVTSQAISAANLLPDGHSLTHNAGLELILPPQLAGVWDSKIRQENKGL